MSSGVKGRNLPKRGGREIWGQVSVSSEILVLCKHLHFFRTLQSTHLRFKYFIVWNWRNLKYTTLGNNVCVETYFGRSLLSPVVHFLFVFEVQLTYNFILASGIYNILIWHFYILLSGKHSKCSHYHHTLLQYCWLCILWDTTTIRFYN